MSDQYRPPERNTPATKSSNTGFIVGGLVVAVALLLWFVLGQSTPKAVDAGGTSNSVTVETPAPADPAAPAPADPVAPAPADPAAPAPAPADPATPAPADPVAPQPADPIPANPPAATTTP